jgi:hypothetical protein
MKQILFTLLALFSFSAQATVDWANGQSYICWESESIQYQFEIPQSRVDAPVAFRGALQATTCEWGRQDAPPFPGWIPEIAKCRFPLGPDAGQKVTLKGQLANGVSVGDVSATITDYGPTGDGDTRTLPCYFKPKALPPSGFTVGN